MCAPQVLGLEKDKGISLWATLEASFRRTINCRRDKRNWNKERKEAKQSKAEVAAAVVVVVVCGRRAPE